MFHSNTAKLISTWRSHREGRALPARTDLSPIDLGPLLPQVFMLGQESQDEEIVRLSGGLMSDLHGRDLRGISFFTLWSKLDRAQVASALKASRLSAAPVVITADALAENGQTIGLELTLCPLIGPSGEADRTLGLYQPISTVARLMGGAIRSLSVRSIEVVEDALPRPSLRLVVDNTRRVA